MQCGPYLQLHGGGAIAEISAFFRAKAVLRLLQRMRRQLK